MGYTMFTIKIEETGNGTLSLQVKRNRVVSIGGCTRTIFTWRIETHFYTYQ